MALPEDQVAVVERQMELEGLHLRLDKAMLVEQVGRNQEDMLRLVVGALALLVVTQRPPLLVMGVMVLLHQLRVLA